MKIEKRRELKRCLALICGSYSASSFPDTLATASPINARLESNQKRLARDRLYDLGTGDLGNLRRLTLRMEDTAVLISRGSKNLLFRGNQKIRITNERLSEADEALPIRPRDLVLDIPALSANKDAWIHIQVETLDSLYIAGRGLYVLLDQLELPFLDIFMHSQTVGIHNINAKELRIGVNGQGTLVASGRVNLVNFSSSQQGSSIFAQNLVTSSINVRPTNTGQLYALNISPNTQASYYNPASTPLNLADLYPVEILGELSGLKFTGPGRAKVGAISQASVEKTKATNAAIHSRLQRALVS